MPSFQKIGGLLTNSMAVDIAALHAAVIAINQAINKHVRYKNNRTFVFDLSKSIFI